MSMLILKVHDRCRSDPSINSAPVGVQNQGSFFWVFHPDLVVIVDRSFSVRDDHLWWCLPWCQDKCLSTLPSSRRSIRGSRKTSARLPRFASAAVVLKAPLMRHAACFWIATKGRLIM
ncbi:hypothetical protein PENANT_c377G03417, partial [Penicillium antarcticum]